MEKGLVSLVIPVHNEEKNIPLVYQEAKEVLNEIQREKGYDYEILFVNDGSEDNSLEILKELKGQDPKVRLLNMDRNRGEASALSAGFFYAKGKFIFSMDGDGQNDPRYLKDLLEKLEEGYLAVSGYRLKRKEPLLTRKLPSWIANFLIRLATGLSTKDNGCSLKGYHWEIPKKRQIPKGFQRFLPALFGVKSKDFYQIPVLDRARLHGRSHYGLKRTFEVLRDLLTIPFLLRRNPQKFENIFRLQCILHLLALPPSSIYLLFSPQPLSLLLFIAIVAGGFINYLIYRNLVRFNRAQEEGVFKVSEL